MSPAISRAGALTAIFLRSDSPATPATRVLIWPDRTIWAAESASTAASRISPTSNIRTCWATPRWGANSASESNTRRAMSESLMQEDVLFCWSGGKDSAMALHAIQTARENRVTALLTTVTEEYDRISMHGVRRILL